MPDKILVVGSVAYDVIFSISQDFRDSIPLTDGEIRKFNASYTAEQKTEVPGGNGGNMAFWLGEENVSCSLFTAFGKDFEEKGYAQKLRDAGADIRGPEGDFTAHAYMISDLENQQLAIWQPNAWHGIDTASLSDFYSDAELNEFQYVIFSVLPPKVMLRLMKEFREKNPDAFVIFDPGQVTPLFDPEIFANCFDCADMLIGNEVEFEHFHRLSALLPESPVTTTRMEIPPKSEMRDCVFLETRGAHGCSVIYEGLEESFPGVENEDFIEATGAGDAFRAGLLSGLSNGKTLGESLQRANELGAECVGLLGPQK